MALLRTNPLRRMSNTVLFLSLLLAGFHPSLLGDTLVYSPPKQIENGKHIVLVSGDEEYRTEETMPMLGKILSQHHGFKCTVLFAYAPGVDAHIDPNASTGVRGWSALDDADLMIIGTRFRTPGAEDAAIITRYLDAGKPLIGIRTSTHAFNGKGMFGEGGTAISYGQFGRKIFGEQWVSHHGDHKIQGGISQVTSAGLQSPIMRGVGPFFTPSDVYGVVHLTDKDTVLLRGAVTETLDPASAPVPGGQNDPTQPFAWLHPFQSPNGTLGISFCTTAGASVDFLDPDLRRLLVNASYYLVGLDVPLHADVSFIDPFQPTFYGFIRDDAYYPQLNLRREDFALGRPGKPRNNPNGTPDWPYQWSLQTADLPFTQLPQSEEDLLTSLPASEHLDFQQGDRIALVGGSLAERMNLFGNFETRFQMRTRGQSVRFRNFGWPADEVSNQQRPGNYTRIDDPLQVYGPNFFLCFFGFNESFAGDDDASISTFMDDYRKWIAEKRSEFTREGKTPQFALVTPIAFEPTGNPLQPSGHSENIRLKVYAAAVKQVASEENLHCVDLFTPTLQMFMAEEGNQYTVNGIHLNEQGDELIAKILERQIFGPESTVDGSTEEYARLREAVNDKSWLHLQDYRMLNGWYVYGGRRTWDTETFPVEFRKIRKMVAVRDQYVWDLAAGKSVADAPDDSETGEVFIPETMFGSRDERFRNGREPKALQYPTPEESIAQMKVPEGFEVELFASEREFPELANPTQLNFDNRGRLWVSCMVNYPQWLPGSAKPGDKLLILEDTDNDGKADQCKTFYDGLICPTGFEFWNGGILVVDEPRILFLKDTDGDDRADQVVRILDGIATDDTHHTMGAWEFSHGGLLHMQEGVSMSTTLETPYGPFRNKGPSGSYVWDLHSLRMHHFRTPGYGNPWCLVFDQFNNGIIGDGTGAQHHWSSLLSGAQVNSRRSAKPIFNNEGMRPAVGNDYLTTRQFPDAMHDDFVYACVINMHGMPRFELRDETEGAGIIGKRIEDLIASTDMFFRPVDPKIGPDGTMWFGDWCNALIGHMQYSQRDPNRDHEHGRIYRLVNRKKPLLDPVTQDGKSIPELLDQLLEFEPRTRYRARRELRSRDAEKVLLAVDQWVGDKTEPLHLCEALWIQESFRQLSPALLDRIAQSADFRARAAAVNSLGNEFRRVPDIIERLRTAVNDPHPRVRLEAIRAASFLHLLDIPSGIAGTEIALSAVNHPTDEWIDYTLEHTLRALEPAWKAGEQNEREQFLASSSKAARDALDAYKNSTGPGKAVYLPLKRIVDVDLPEQERRKALAQLVIARGGSAKRGQEVFRRVCANCHQHGEMGKKFGPTLTDVGDRLSREQIITSIVWPNEVISKGYETVLLLMDTGDQFSGFILEENDRTITLGLANGKQETLDKDFIEIRKERKASSMPEGLTETIAAIEFLDLVEFLAGPNVRARDLGGPLRSYQGLPEISRNASFIVPETFPAYWAKDADLLLSGVDPNRTDFTIHSAEGRPEPPTMVIRLAKPSQVQHVWLQNRRDRTFHGRAKGLALWFSSDGKKWELAWTSPQPQAEWHIDIPEPLAKRNDIRYVKVGLNQPGIFHLNRIAMFGQQPSAQ